MTGIVTIISKNYLPYARVLMSSVAQWQPEAQRFVVLTDEPEEFFDAAAEPFLVIRYAELGLPRPSWFACQYTVLELNTAVKPWVLALLFARYGVEKLIYLDPDIRLYAPLEQVSLLLDQAAVVLTPHLTHPVDDSRKPTELDILRSGTYNLGFLALRRGQVADTLLRWWQGHLQDQCRLDFAAGLFVDQRWMDLVPGLFSEVAILRDPGHNVAYWNAKQRPIVRSGSGYQVLGRPLVFFHFSGIAPDDPESFSRYQDRLRLADLGDGAELVESYIGALQSAGYQAARHWPYTHRYLADGTALPDLCRRAQDQQPDLSTQIPDPYSPPGSNALLDFWNTPQPGVATRVTRFGYEIWRSRSDLQALFPDPLRRDENAWITWLFYSGKHEHSIPEALLTPVRDALAPPVIVHAPEPEPAAPLLAGFPEIISLLYAQRADLQATFPSPTAADRPAFARWLRQHGRREYALTPEELATIDALEPPGGAERLRAPLDVLRKRRQTGDQAAGEQRRQLLLSPPPPPIAQLLLPPGDRLAAKTLFNSWKNLLPDAPPGSPQVRLTVVSDDNPGEVHEIAWCAWPWNVATPALISRLNQAREVWTPSTFTRDVLGPVLQVPVIHMPFAAPASTEPPPSRGFRFLCLVDALAVERQNPWSALEAYDIAFGGNPNVHFTVGVEGGSEELWQQLAKSARGVTLRAAGPELLQEADCIVSLHRTESWNPYLIQAMAAGIPVLCTGYGGPLEYARPHTAFLVDYRLRHTPALPGTVWADPLLPDAVHAMRLVTENGELRQARARAGQQLVQQQYGPEVIAAKLKERLLALAQHAGEPR